MRTYASRDGSRFPYAVMREYTGAIKPRDRSLKDAYVIWDGGYATQEQADEMAEQRANETGDRFFVVKIVSGYEVVEKVIRTVEHIR